MLILSVFSRSARTLLFANTTIEIDRAIYSIYSQANMAEFRRGVVIRGFRLNNYHSSLSRLVHISTNKVTVPQF